MIKIKREQGTKEAETIQGRYDCSSHLPGLFTDVLSVESGININICLDMTGSFKGLDMEYVAGHLSWLPALAYVLRSLLTFNCEGRSCGRLVKDREFGLGLA